MRPIICKSRLWTHIGIAVYTTMRTSIILTYILGIYAATEFTLA